MFSSLHSSLAPPKTRKTSSESSISSIENFSSVSSSPIMSDHKRKAPMPPNGAHHVVSTQMETVTQNAPPKGRLGSIKEIENPGYVEVDESQHGKRPSLPLPDYETLFPQKRHGVQGSTRWDHIIAEVNQKQRRFPPDLIGPEMSVDGPEEPTTNSEPSFKERSIEQRQQPEPRGPKPVSSKKAAAPPPPKPVAATPPRSVADLNQHSHQSFTQVHMSVERPNVSSVTSNMVTSKKEAPSVLPRNEAPKVPASYAAVDHSSMLHPSPRTVNTTRQNAGQADDLKEIPVSAIKEIPQAKPRQRVTGKELVQQIDHQVTPLVLVSKHSDQALSMSVGNNKDKDRKLANDRFPESDPFPSSDLLTKDPWTHPDQNHHTNDLFTGRAQKELKPVDQGMTPEDLDKLFLSEKQTLPSAIFNDNDSEKYPQQEKKDSNQLSPMFQRRNSQKRKPLLPPQTQHRKDVKSLEDLGSKNDTTLTTADQNSMTEKSDLPVMSMLQPQTDIKTQSNVYGGERVETSSRRDPFGADPFSNSSPMHSVPTGSEPLQAVEEPAPQQGDLSGGKSPLRAWVSPSEVQSHISNGGGLGLSLRRPHPVKPLSSSDTQQHTGTPAVREIKSHDIPAGKIKVADSVESGPYTQLTQEELITLVVKQQTELSKKDAKIFELEEYIDNLLVRVIEEQPSILMALNGGKPT